MSSTVATYTLQLFHVGDQEANARSVSTIPNFSAVLSYLRAEDLDGDGDEGFADTLTVASGDVWIPGLFYDASEQIYGDKGAADILIQNELGIQAAAFGNHEFDNGTESIGKLLTGFPEALGNLPFDGARFPYLSGNLDFSADANLAGLVVADAQLASDIPGRIAASTIVETGSGERIGVVGATTPTLQTISSPGADIVVSPTPFDSDNAADIQALAEVIQADVDTLLAAEPGLDKVILLAHMQQIGIEQQLGSLLRDVDIIVAGGSNTRLFDADDEGFGGEAGQGSYPIEVTAADGNPVLVVNTDFQYKYVGRLVIDFDANGVIIPESYDPAVSGAYATDDAGVERLGAAGFEDPEIVEIVERVGETIVQGESEFYAVTDVFLNGERQGGELDGVRTQETNLGNLTADANLYYAGLYEEDVVVSIKNGGGIRSSIGQILVPGGGTEPVRLPPEEVPGAKPEGGISRNDVANVLSFNNDLSLLTLTSAELAQTFEHIVSEYSSLEVDGGMGQIGGAKFSFDPTLPEGDRILSAGVFDANDELIAEIVRDGEVVENPDQTFRVVTLNFLADGGSGYPFPDFAATSDRVDLSSLAPVPGGAAFVPGSEQDALAEYLLATFGNEADDPAFAEADTPPAEDTRIQIVGPEGFREDTVLGAAPEPADADGPLRVASFNASLNRNAEGALIADLSDGENAQARAVAEIIQRNAPDVLLVNELDVDAEGEAARLFQQNYLSVSQNGADPIEYPHVYVFPSNTGVPTGFDLDNDGRTDGPGDAFGFGFFEGQFGFALFSKHPIDEAGVRTFQNFLWKDMPGALLFDTENGQTLFDPANPDASFYTAEEADILRLSSKNHVDIPVMVGGETVHVLAAHPTPPVFDGDEDRNGKRNFDEIRFWKDYVAGAGYIYDDAGNRGGLSPDAAFVIVGDYNADPFDGDSFEGAADQLLSNRQIEGSATDPAITPSSEGGPDAAERQGGANLTHRGDPAFDTADFGFNRDDPSNDRAPGNLRVDYALPSTQGLAIVDAGVFWQASTDPLFPLAEFPTSDHRLVYVDVTFADDRRTVEALDTTRSAFLGQVTFATGTPFEGTEIGGLSALTWDPATGHFFALSDDRSSDARYYTLDIDLTDGRLQAGDIVFEDVTTLTRADGTRFESGTIDPEGLAFVQGGGFYLSSEGDANQRIAPAVFRLDQTGRVTGELPVDDKFLPRPAQDSGIRNNLAFESLTLTPDQQTLYVATENALAQDGPRADLEQGSASRIVQYDVATGEAVAEFVYETDPVPAAPVPADGFRTSGLVELLAVDNTGTLLALERAFSAGVGNTIKLYEVQLQGATDVSGVRALPVEDDDGAIVPVVDEVAKKRLLLDFAELGITLDNIEGMTFGPELADGRQSLIVVSDNNFSDTQFTQVLAFGLDIDRVPTVTPVAETPDELRYPGAEPIVIGHRGASGELPEHTLGAYARAIADGADFIEPDLVSTKDGVLIARHEPWLARVETDDQGNPVRDADGNVVVTFASTDVAMRPEFADRLTTKDIGFNSDALGFGSVTGWFAEDFTLEEIKTLRAVEDQPELRPQSALYDGLFEIPTLDEIIDLVQAHEVRTGETIGIYPETKEPSYFDSIGLSLEENLIRTLVDQGFTDPDRVFIQSFEIANLLDLQENVMPAAGIDVPLVQLLFNAPTFPTFDLVEERLTGGDFSRYESLGFGATTVSGDLYTAEGLQNLADVYAEGVGPALSLVFDATSNLVENAQNVDLLVHAYTHRDEAQVTGPDGEPLSPAAYYTRILETGVDGVFTDHPATGRQATDALFAVEGSDPDDPAIWLDPTNADDSVIVTAMKNGGLRVYDLEGEELQRITPENIRYNNVDVLYGVALGGSTVDLFVASDRANDTLAIFRIDPETRQLTDVTAPALREPSFSIFGVDDGEATAYGLATYRSREDGKLYAFTTQADGNQIAQLELKDAGDGRVTAEVVRTIALPVADGDDAADYQSEGIAVDRETGIVYVTVEDKLGVVRFGAEPTDPAEVEVIVDIGASFFTPDLEGISILYGEDGRGALVVSSQGNSTFAAFDRETYAYLGSFAIGEGGTLDGVEESDGLEIFASALGSAFPNGLLVTQDGSNEPGAVFGDPDDGEIQNFNVNFKLTDLQDVVERLDVPTPDAGFDPRATVAVGTEGNDTLRAESDGPVVVLGADGNDRLFGGLGFAVLRGEAGRDTLQAGDGGARLVGGADRDTLIGGSGPDTFVLDGGGPDLVRGFDAAADTIELAIAGIVDTALVQVGPNQRLDVDTGDGFTPVALILGGGVETSAIDDTFIG